MISGISSNYTSQIASTLFAKLDSKNQGYFDKLDLKSALATVGSLSDTEDSFSVDDVFSQMDGNGDGKVTQDELTSSLQKLADELTSQYNSMRMGGMPPPPPPEGGGRPVDEGYTKEALQSQLDEIGSTDSRRSSLLTEIVDNFGAADADGNGKVTFAEAMAYDQANNADATAAAGTAASDAASATTAGDDLKLMRMVMELMRAYGSAAFQADSGGFSATA